MKTERYYTSEELDGMSKNEMRDLLLKEQSELQEMRWRMIEIKELLTAALQSLPKMVKL